MQRREEHPRGKGDHQRIVAKSPAIVEADAPQGGHREVQRGQNVLRRGTSSCSYPVFFELIGEPVKRLERLVGEPIRTTVKPGTLQSNSYPSDDPPPDIGIPTRKGEVTMRLS